MKEPSPVAKGLWILCAGFLLLANLPAMADGSASDTIKRASERMLSALESQRAAVERDPTKIYGMVDEILVPHFDFQKITRAAVGKPWTEASPAQQQALTKSFQELLIRTYAKALLSYSGEEIRFLPEKQGPKSTVVVPTEVRDPRSAETVPIEYRLYKKGGSWKVFDVKIDAISLVENYHQMFKPRLRRKNGVDGLIDDLNRMNAKGKG